jgi:hypothetical protein
MDDLLVPTSIDDMIQMVTSLVLLTKKKKLNLMLCALVPAVHFSKCLLTVLIIGKLNKPTLLNLINLSLI